MIRSLILAMAAAASATLAAAEPMVLAAASTSGVIDAAIAESGQAATTSYGASGTLARQIEQGAPADLFVSANDEWMEALVAAGLVAPESVRVLMSNRLVLIAPAGAGPVTPETLLDRLGEENFAMADPATAPVGAYGQAALQGLGLWDGVATHLIPTRNTTATVAAVAQGEAAFGLAYASDAAGQAGVDVVWQIPAETHPPIRYLAAPVAQGTDPDGAARLLDYLTGPGGQAILTAKGFTAAPGGGQ